MSPEVLRYWVRWRDRHAMRHAADWPRRVLLSALWLLLIGGPNAGCGLFGGDEPAEPEPGSLLKTIISQAPPGSRVQFLAGLAESLGWEPELQDDPYLWQAVADDSYQERVEPRLLGLFFQNGFSVLPSVGEGHEFTRDTLMQGPVANARYLVRAPGEVRIVFLERADNIVIVYPKRAPQPQVFSRLPDSNVVLRESRLENYLN